MNPEIPQSISISFILFTLASSISQPHSPTPLFNSLINKNNTQPHQLSSHLSISHFPSAWMKCSDLQAAFLVFFQEQAARLQGRAGTARRARSCLERRTRAGTLTPFIAASRSRAFHSLTTHQHNGEYKILWIWSSTGTEGSPGLFINNFESTLCWLRGGASPGVNFQLVPALSSSLALHSLRGAGWLMIIPHVLSRGFFPPSSSRTPKGCRKLLFGMQGESSYHSFCMHTLNLKSCMFEY